LNGIISFTALLMKTDINPRQKRYTANLNQWATTNLVIINNILAFSKIDKGKLELELRGYLHKKVLEAIRRVDKYDLEQKNLKLRMYIEKSIPHILFVDQVRLKQLVLYLGRNATKFTYTITLKINKEI
jgi:signal transduction histidine kinase